jgi:hypothetical protein
MPTHLVCMYVCVCSQAIKNEAELAGMREAHLRDAVAVCEFLCDMEAHVRPGGRSRGGLGKQRLQVVMMLDLLAAVCGVCCQCTASLQGSRGVCASLWCAGAPPSLPADPGWGVHDRGRGG